MSASEFAEWKAFSIREPFGFRRQDWGFALLSMVMSNSWRDGKSPPHSIDEFLLKFHEDDADVASSMENKIGAVFGKQE